MTYEADEILDIVNVDDVVVGQMARSEYYRTESKPGFIRSVNLFLVNSKGQIWVPTRALTQRIKPGALDFSAGGHVSTGETYEQAMLREAEEELGMPINKSELIYLGKLPPNGTPGRDDYFCVCYAYLSDDIPHYPKDEYSNSRWLLPHKLIAHLDAGIDAKDSIRDSLGLLLRYQADSQRNQ